jgi:hypothetical protein
VARPTGPRRRAGVPPPPLAPMDPRERLASHYRRLHGARGSGGRSCGSGGRGLPFTWWMSQPLLTWPRRWRTRAALCVCLCASPSRLLVAALISALRYFLARERDRTIRPHSLLSEDRERSQISLRDVPNPGDFPRRQEQSRVHDWAMQVSVLSVKQANPSSYPHIFVNQTSVLGASMFGDRSLIATVSKFDAVATAFMISSLSLFRGVIRRHFLFAARG